MNNVNNVNNVNKIDKSIKKINGKIIIGVCISIFLVSRYIYYKEKDKKY
jgi:hypothetical protein